MTERNRAPAAKPQAIDAHAHLVPPTLAAEVEKSGKALGVTVENTPQGPKYGFENLPPLRPAAGTITRLDVRREWMDRQGLAQQFVGSWLDIQGYSLEAKKAAAWAHLLNEHLSRTTEVDKQRFRALATVPVQDGTLAAKELEYAIKTLKMLGVMIAADPAGQDISADHMEPFWAAVASMNVPVVLHPASHGFGTKLPQHLRGNLGRTLDTTIAITNLILKGVLDRHKNIRMMLVHGGGYFPYQIERTDQGYLGGAVKLGKDLERGRPSAYVPVLYYDTVNMSSEAIKFLRNVAGIDHVLLGSDYVFDAKEPITEEVQKAGFSATDVEKVLSGNARRVFLS